MGLLKKLNWIILNSSSKYCCCLVAQLCPTLFMTPWTVVCQAPLSSTVFWSLLKSISIKLVMLSSISSSAVSFSFCLHSFPTWGSFPMSRIFASGGQSIRNSILASVLPVNIQGWFPLLLTAFISLLSKGLSRVLQHHNLKASILWLTALFMV